MKESANYFEIGFQLTLSCNLLIWDINLEGGYVPFARFNNPLTFLLFLIDIVGITAVSKFVMFKLECKIDRVVWE